MYGKGNNYSPNLGQNSQTPTPSLLQQPLIPPNNFQNRPLVNYSTPFQYNHPLLPPPQHAPQPSHLPPAQQVHSSNPVPHTQQIPPPPPFRPEMFPYRGSNNNLPLPPPPPSLPNSNFYFPVLNYSVGPTPPPLPPSSPPPVPSSPPPIIFPLSSEFPQNPKLSSISISDDKAESTSEVGSQALENLSSEENEEFDLFSPPQKPEGENVVRKIEVLCRFIAKNGPGFENMTFQKESGNPEFAFLVGGEPGSEAAVAHDYFKWAKKKFLLQHRESNSAVRLSELGTSSQTNLMDGDASPSLSDMEMEDDFTQHDEMNRKTVYVPEEHNNQEHLCEPQNNSESNFPQDTVSAFSQLAEEENGPAPSLQDDQPTHDSFSGGVILNPSPTREAKLEENSYIGVSSTPPHENINLIVNYASDESSEHDDKPFVTVPQLTLDFNTNIHGEIQSITDPGKDIFPSPELESGKSFESGGEHSCPKSPQNNQKPFLKSHITVKDEEFVEKSNEHQKLSKVAVSPEKIKHRYQIEDEKRASNIQKIDEFGRLVRDIASDSDPDDSYRSRKHSKRGRSRSHSPHDRRRSHRSPRRRREKRSWSRSWSPKKRRSRSRSQSHRHGIESGGERARREKSRHPDCMDFLRGRCYRGASCRYLHHENNKKAGARYNRSTRISDHRDEIEISPSKLSVGDHNLHGSSSVFFKNESEKKLYPEKGKPIETNAMVLESPDLKDKIFKSTVTIPELAHLQNEEENDHAVDRLMNDGSFVNSLVDPSHPIAFFNEDSATEISQTKNQIQMSQPELNKNTSSISNQGDHLEPPPPPPPLPHGTAVPPPLHPQERVQPPIHIIYPYQNQFQIQQPQYPTLPNTWSLPPPPPLQPQFSNNFSTEIAIQGIPPQFQQNQFPPRNNYGMIQPQSYPVPSIDDLASKPLFTNNTVNQTYGGHLSSFPLPSVSHSENTNFQSCPGNNFPSNEIPQQPQPQPQPQYGLHRPPSDGPKFGEYGNINVPFGGSKITHHYNPYASVFDQPFDSKFNSNTNPSHILSHNPIDARNVISPPKNTEKPKSGSDQYDPLFDSIEPSSNSSKKIDQSQGPESNLRLSSRNALGVEENYLKKESENIAIKSNTSIKSNDEFGETADAEVGEVESERSTPGKEKKNKDSKSLKLFKSSLAEYVKEVLKPHWRQGGMSKEAFKIIVKKTIDKVSGAMKSHHIPKSQEKINRYIDSSERKLNKLVMGYVDKYAKI